MTAKWTFSRDPDGSSTKFTYEIHSGDDQIGTITEQRTNWWVSINSELNTISTSEWSSLAEAFAWVRGFESATKLHTGD